MVAPEPRRERLKELLRARAQLLELKKIEASWAEHPPADHGLRRQAQARGRLLDKQLEAIVKQIRPLAQSGEMAARSQRLQQAQGVGEVTAWTLLAEMPELGMLEEGKAGLAPHPRDSSKQKGKRHIQQGRPQVRRVLYMAAITACRCNPVLKVVYQRLRTRGKPAKLAIIAIARRLIELLNLMLKNPNFCLSK